MFQVFFTKENKMMGYRQTLNADTERFRTFRNLMLQRGVHFHPDGMKRIMISAAHDELDVERVLGAAEETLRELPRTH